MAMIASSYAGHLRFEEKHGDYIKKWLLGMYHLRVFLIQFIICCIISYRVESLNLKQRQKSKAAEINMRDLWLLLHTFIHIPLMLPVNCRIVINDNLIFVFFLFIFYDGGLFMWYIVWPYNCLHFNPNSSLFFLDHISYLTKHLALISMTIKFLDDASILMVYPF